MVGKKKLRLSKSVAALSRLVAIAAVSVWRLLYARGAYTLGSCLGGGGVFSFSFHFISPAGAGSLDQKSKASKDMFN